jgi:hypothetical protein
VGSCSFVSSVASGEADPVAGCGAVSGEDGRPGISGGIVM